MTLSAAKRRRIRTPKKRRSMAGDLGEGLRVLVAKSTTLTWPSPKYAKDPVAFSRDILGFDPWERQAEVMRAVVDHPLVSVKSGHRVGKSWLVSALAHWFYCSFEDARVICTAPTATSVQGIVWRAIRQHHSRSGRCLASPSMVSCSVKSHWSDIPASSTTRRSWTSPHRPRTVGCRRAPDRRRVSSFRLFT